VDTASATAQRGDAYSFAKTQGLYDGLSLEGAGILEREGWNADYYGAGATPEGIVKQRRVSNKYAEILRTALAPY
jgi:lipid-binding SYLF domain-containing protein